MDSREVKFPRYMVYTCGIAVLTALSIGYVIGSPNIPERAMRGIDGKCGPDPYTKQGGFYNCFEYADLMWGFAVGSFCLGALLTGLTGGNIQNAYGRRMTMLIANIFFIVGALLLGFTESKAQFVVGRVIAGMGCGLGGVVVPTYLGEVASIKSRGAMGSCFQLMVVTGILVSNAVGIGLSYPPKWRICMALLGVPALIQLAMLPSLVESPKWLITQNRAEDARRALQKLRGDANIDNEFSDMIIMILKQSDTDPNAVGGVITDADVKDQVKRDDSGFEKNDIKVDNPAAFDLSNYRPPKSYTVIYLFKSECRYLALQGILLHFFQQASGMNGLIIYSTTFLNRVFGKDQTKYLTLGTSAANLLATFVAVYSIDKVGRRTLLLISSAGCTISSIVLFSGGYANVGDLVVIAVFFFIMSFAVGLGPIPWLMLSELLPSYALSPASAVATSVNWFSNFIISWLFQNIVTSMGNATFILFAAICAACFFYVLFFLPETKGRRVEDIMAERGVGPRSDI
ncbi:Solute carrier 2, facilitated glucose transporter member 2 [Haplosporangium sp. Z 27]|nr:Solute carrier 2, facilitated glucose transporter member 2 [Haplosporangium sp. Z 27]